MKRTIRLALAAVLVALLAMIAGCTSPDSETSMPAGANPPGYEGNVSSQGPESEPTDEASEGDMDANAPAEGETDATAPAEGATGGE